MSLVDITTQNVYMRSMIILIITTVLVYALLRIMEGVIKHFPPKKKKVNIKVLTVLETPLVLLIVLGGIQMAVKKIMYTSTSFDKFILSLIIVVTTYLLMRFGDIILASWARHVSKTKGEEFHSEILPLTKSILGIVLSIVAIILILQVWGVQVATMLTSLGIAGAIIGLAFKETLENVLGGISLIVDNSFKKGDFIELEGGEVGEIQEINLRSTRMRNFDSEIIIVPNGILANKKIVNLAQPTPTLRLKIPVSVAYGSDPEQVKQVLHDSMRGNPDILKMPRREVFFTGYGDSSIDFVIFFYIKEFREHWRIKDNILTQLYKDLYAAGIEIPFPIRTLVTASKGQYNQKWKNKDTKKVSPVVAPSISKTKSKSKKSSVKKKTAKKKLVKKASTRKKKP